MSVHEQESAQMLAQELRNGLAVMNDWIGLVSTDPGQALANLTWLGLALAQNCQEKAEYVIHTVEEDAQRRFFAMDGALFRSNGSVVTLSREYFTVLGLPTDEGAVR